jgi:hypothetical protein
LVPWRIPPTHHRATAIARGYSSPLAPGSRYPRVPSSGRPAGRCRPITAGSTCRAASSPAFRAVSVRGQLLHSCPGGVASVSFYHTAPPTNKQLRDGGRPPHSPSLPRVLAARSAHTTYRHKAGGWGSPSPASALHMRRLDWEFTSWDSGCRTNRPSRRSGRR